MSLVKEQLAKEKIATKRIWRWCLRILIIFWGILGLSYLASSLWPLGLIFILGAAYVWYRTKPKEVPNEK